MNNLPALNGVTLKLLSQIHILYSMRLRTSRIQMLTGLPLKKVNLICKSFGSISYSKGRELQSDAWFLSNPKRMWHANIFWQFLLRNSHMSDRVEIFIHSYRQYIHFNQILSGTKRQLHLQPENAAWVIRHIVTGEWESRLCECKNSYITQTINPINRCVHCNHLDIKTDPDQPLHFQNMSAESDIITNLYNDTTYDDISQSNEDYLPTTTQLSYKTKLSYDELLDFIQLANMGVSPVKIKWLLSNSNFNANRLYRLVTGKKSNPGQERYNDEYFFRCKYTRWQLTMFMNIYQRIDPAFTISKRFIHAYRAYQYLASEGQYIDHATHYLSPDDAVFILKFQNTRHWESRECMECGTEFISKWNEIDQYCPACDKSHRCLSKPIKRLQRTIRY